MQLLYSAREILKGIEVEDDGFEPSTVRSTCAILCMIEGRRQQFKLTIKYLKTKLSCMAESGFEPFGPQANALTTELNIF